VAHVGDVATLFSTSYLWLHSVLPCSICIAERLTDEIPDIRIADRRTHEFPNRRTHELPDTRADEIPDIRIAGRRTHEFPNRRTHELPDTRADEIPNELRVPDRRTNEPRDNPLVRGEHPRRELRRDLHRQRGSGDVRCDGNERGEQRSNLGGGDE
jgi:hypothetical protein